MSVAGKPQKRRRRDREGIPEYPDASTDGTDAPSAHDARERSAAARYRPMRAPAAGPPGTRTKARADEAVADELQSLAAQLRPGITVRLERLRPGWAAGFLEEYPLQDGDLSELYDHVQTEHGGQLYKITVLNPAGSAWYDSRIKVAGPPRERGRIIDRDAYEGVSAPKATPQQSPQQPQQAQPSGMPDLMSVFSLVLQQQQQASEAQLQAVREMVSRSSEQTRELISTIVTQRGEDRRHTSISGQLEELSEAGQVMERVREMFGAQDREKADDTDPIVKEAMSHFARQVFGSQSRNSPPQQTPQQPRSRMPRTRRAPPDNVIPMAGAGASGEGGDG